MHLIMFVAKILRIKPSLFFRKNHTIPKDRLRDKVAIVTASTKGIGFAIAKRLAQEGAKVIVSSRKQEHVDEALRAFESQNLNVTGLVCHVSKDEDRKKLMNEANKLGGVDILISNAAINPSPALIIESSEEVWDKIFDVNLRSSYLLSKEVIPVFKRKGGGNIVYISSYVAYQPSIVPNGVVGIYSISKTALLGLTKALAYELATDNIRVNCVCPGSIKTKFGNYIIEREDTANVVLASIPMRRFGDPDEISGAVAFLVGDDSSYITGESITVAGGGPSRL